MARRVSRRKYRRGRVKSRQRLIFSTCVAAIVVIVVVLVLTGALSGAEFDPEQAAIPANVRVNGVDVGGMTKAEAKLAVADTDEEKMESLTIVYQIDQETVEFGPGDFKVSSDLDEVLQTAVMLGREEDAQQRSESSRKLREGGVDLTTSLLVDEGSLKQAVTELAQTQFNKDAIEPYVTLRPDENTRFAYHEGANGREVDVEALVAKTVDHVKSGERTAIVVDYHTIQPAKAMEDLYAETEFIAAYTTSFAGNGLDVANRVFNVAKATEAVDAKIIGAGETFSVNDALGPRTEANGWKAAAGIEDGTTTQQYGGGICQASSTLFVAALKSEVTVVSRTRHSWPVSYVPAGMDATINTGGPDLLLRNDKSTPVYLFAKVDSYNKTLTVAFYGTPLEDGKTIEITAQKLSEVAPPDPKVILDEKMASNTRAIIKKERAGCVAETYKTVYDADGNQISEPEKIYTTTYPAFQGEYYAGPKDADNPDAPVTIVPLDNRYPAPLPSPSPTPSPSPGDVPQEPEPTVPEDGDDEETT
ncbi:MAG: VanW family protein [Christensenellales bacterium]|jgi:vancomycin resistance protein YoaR